MAREIVALYHGKDLAEKAEENFEKTFSKGGIPDDVLSVTVAENVPLIDVLLSEKIVESKNEWKRLLGEGAVTEMTSGEKIVESNIKATEGTYKIGKRRFIKITK